MPRYRLRSRWLGIFAAASILAVCGFWLARFSRSVDPVKQGWAAYARGEWEVAGERARERLKAAGDDTAALRLLANASVRLGLDASALAVYGRLGPDAMTPDDLCLLGLALTRTGNPRGLEVWEQARSQQPNNPETLFELTRAYFSRERFAEAAETGRSLAGFPGWEGRALALLGAIELARNDPEGALTFWRRSLERKKAEKDAGPTPTVPPKEFARALLQVHQPEEARLLLERVLPSDPDHEGFWLLSRAYLQEGEKNKALGALEKSVPFREEKPLVPEPSRFVGSNRCSECHPAIFRSQQSSRHAHTFLPVAELGDLVLPAESFPDPGQGKVTHSIRRLGDKRLRQETHVENQVYSAVVDYAFGSGDRGLTLVGRGDSGQAFELRLSQYRTGTGLRWDMTSGHFPRPDLPMRYLGESLTEDSVRRCLSCHVTSAQAILQASGPGASDHGIGCEKCHGPGENHILAIKAGFPDMAIVDPRMASGSRVVALCAECHSPRRGVVSQDDPTAVRFQGTTLTWSRCYLESQDKLDCITCHDPHTNAVKSTSHYEGKCLSCHTGASGAGDAQTRSKPTRESETSRPAACPVNPRAGCIACHMPSVKNVVPHSSFTDHFIRVHRE
jgi:tetratricopeptide (TPR) repeat protein